MNTLTFLQRVLPPEGFYATILINDGAAPQQAFFDTVEELATSCERSNRLGNNTYYALSSFASRANRKQTNALLTKALFIDIDCGPDKPFANQKEGLAALLDFLTKSKMPKPMIVSSGNGLHVYWVLSEAIAPEQWQPLADGLKKLHTNLGFDVDPKVTADLARVLRPVGTINPRGGKEVRVLMDAAATDLHTLQNLLCKDNHLVSDPGTITRTPESSSLLSSLAVQHDFPPSVGDVVARKCQQVKWAVENQDKVSEPVWYALMGIAAYCENPEEVAKQWSSKHPDYSEIETVRKVQQWKANTTGPTTCKQMELERPKGCNKCPMLGKIGSPTRLGLQQVEIPITADAPDVVAKVIPLPKPFKRSHRGIVQTIDGTDIDICAFDLYPVGYGKDESLGYETVRYKWKRPHVGWQDLAFRQAYLNDDSREFPTAIADQGIVLNGRNQVKGFQFMLRAYMNELRSIKSMTNIHGTMGWKEDFTRFVIGDRLYKREPDGSVVVEDISLTSATSKMGSDLYSHVGTIEGWKHGARLLETASMPWHMFGLCQTFAAPLWAFTGLKGLTLSLCGPTGGGKSLIQLWQQSVWGDPEKLHVAAKFTQNALFSRLGVYCNLPMTIDEATMMEDVGDFCYWVTQGRDKARLNRRAEEREAKEWATTVTVSTNVSFIAKMAASGLETDAQMARLLEIQIPPHKMFEKSSNAGRTIFKYLMANHGVIGDAYIKALLRKGKAQIIQRVAEVTDDFHNMYNCSFVGAERFWEQDLILVHVGSELAYEEGLIDFDYRKGIQWVIEQLDALRITVEDNKTDGFRLVHEYLNEIAADALTVMHTKDTPPTLDHHRIPRGEVKARFDVYRNTALDKFTHGTVMLVRKPFKQWVSSRGYDYNTLCKEVKAEGIDATPATKRFAIGKDTELRLGQQYVFGVNLCHPYMHGFLDTIQQNAEGLTLGQLTLVD